MLIRDLGMDNGTAMYERKIGVLLNQDSRAARNTVVWYVVSLFVSMFYMYMYICHGMYIYVCIYIL